MADNIQPPAPVEKSKKGKKSEKLAAKITQTNTSNSNNAAFNNVLKRAKRNQEQYNLM